jgi:hypothetical protein
VSLLACPYTGPTEEAVYQVYSDLYPRVLIIEFLYYEEPTETTSGTTECLACGEQLYTFFSEHL